MSITLFTAGGTRFRVEPLCVVPAALAFISGNGRIFIITFISLVLHEAAHTAMAYACSARVSDIVFHPLGMRAQLAENGINQGDSLMIACAGPIFSLTAGIAGHAAFDAFLSDSATLLCFAQINSALALINLLPAPPLDGAEILKALIAPHVSAKTLKRTVFFFGSCTAAIIGFFAVIGIVRGKATYAAVAFAVLLALETLISIIHTSSALSAQKKRTAIARNGTVRVREVAVCGSTCALEALKLHTGGAYVRFVVLDEEMKERTVIGEGEAIQMIAALGADITFLEIASRSVRIDQSARG